MKIFPNTILLQIKFLLFHFPKNIYQLLPISIVSSKFIIPLQFQSIIFLPKTTNKRGKKIQ